MKKTILLAIGVIASVMGHAQYMPDTTVQICAYWTKGDKIVYDCSHKQAQKTKTGEEHIVSSSKETRVFEVTDETEKSYMLKMSYKDILDNNAQVNVSNQLLNKLSQNLVINVKTNEMGSVEDVVDIEQVVKTLKDQINIVANDIYAKNEEMQKVFTKEQLVAVFNELCTPQFIMQTCYDDIVPLLTYHGGRYDIGKKYEVEQAINIGSHTLKGTMTFMVDPEDSDSTYAVIRSYTIFDGETVFPICRDFVFQTLKAIKPDINEKELEEGFREAIEKKHMTATLEQMTTTIIHVSSGWTTDWYYERVMTVKDDDGETQMTDSRSVVFREMDTEN